MVRSALSFRAVASRTTMTPTPGGAERWPVQLDDVVIVEAVRTPIGRRNGSLKDVRPDELMAHDAGRLVRRAGIDPGIVDDVILGCVAQIGEQGANIARLAVLEAGFPVEVPAVSLDRMCSSGQQAVHFAAQAIASGQADVVIAGGVESMSRIPMVSDYPTTWSPKLLERPDVEISTNQGVSADLIAERWGLTREETGPVLVREPPAGRRGIRVRAGSPARSRRLTCRPRPGHDAAFSKDEGIGCRRRWSGWQHLRPRSGRAARPRPGTPARSRTARPRCC